MQVEHETQLIEPSTIKAIDFSPKEYQTLDVYTLAQTTFNAIEYLISCPNGFLIAAYLRNANQVVILDTKTYIKRERFPLKSCNKNYSRFSFALKAIDFSPDGTRLAIGQSDCIIYIYKLASQSSSLSSEPSTNTKTILTGKFVCSSPVTCLVWTEVGIIFGTQDGKIKLVQTSPKTAVSDSQTSSTRVIPIYNSPEGTLPISLAFKSQCLAIGFINCSIVITGLTSDLLIGELVPNVVEPGSTRRNSSVLSTSSIKHSCPPYHMIFIQPNILCCAGPDGRLSFNRTQSEDFHTAKLDSSTAKQQALTSLQTIDLKEDIVAVDYSQANEILSIVTTNRLLFSKYDQDQSSWHLENSSIEFNETYILTSFKWLRDGSQFAVGTILGTIELFRCTWNKHSIGEQLDICHIAKNKVRITDRARNLLATYKSQQYDIKKVNLLDGGQSVIIWTNNSLIVARLGQSAPSELPWGRDRNVKFCFDHPGFVFIYNCTTHQLNLVKLGENRVVFSIKVYPVTKSTICARQYSPNLFKPITDYDKTSPNRQPQTTDSPRSRHPSISAQPDSLISSLEPGSNLEVKVGEVERLAFISNSDSLVIINLKQNNSQELRLQHSTSISWIELSHTSNHIVFQDSSNLLYLVNLTGDLKNSLIANLLLEDCEFAKWIPNSDILIAQSSYKILIWYSIEEPNQPTIIDSRLDNITSALPIIDLSLMTKAYPTINKLDISSYQLVLSNRRTIPLDSLKIKFFTQIINKRLDFALDTLKRDDSDVKHLNLWTKLGWFAIEKCDCTVAIQVFKRLNYDKLVRYLENCLQNPAELEWRLAMLRGDWISFESLAEPEKIVLTYKRLNKWSKALDYLTRTQQFRQRDIVEHEYKQWLITKGRYLEAAQIQAKTDDLMGGLELLMSKEKYEDAADLIVTYASHLPDEKLLELARKLKSKLIAQENSRKAALVCDKILNESQDALDLYLKSKSYEDALDLASRVAPDKVNEIEELLGEYLIWKHESNLSLMSRKEAFRAIDSFVKAGKVSRALSAAVKLNQFERGFQILISQTEAELDKLCESSREECKLISNFKMQHGKLEDAVKAFLVSGQYEQVVSLYVNRGKFNEAYEIALKQVNANDREKTTSYFKSLAEEFIRKNEYDKAESIYLLLNLPDLAIELHRTNTKNHNRMLELVEEYQPDQVEGTLLMLARELESQGRLDMAESYLLRISDSEWTNVVRMYRLAGKWADAFRVAREHCASKEDPLLVQLAYWWCKSLTKDSPDEESNKAAHTLLEQLNLFDQVVEFCCENKNFPFAIQLSSFAQTPTRRKHVSRRFASFLEEQHKFKEAELVLLDSGQVEEATKMYVDNDMPNEALRLIEGQLNNAPDSTSEDERESLVNLLNKTLIRYADRTANEVSKIVLEQQSYRSKGNLLRQRQPIDDSLEKKLLAAQQMYLRAQRPDLAVAMYKERGLWHEAIQVAQRFAPQLLEGVERALDEQLASELPLSDIAVKGKKSLANSNTQATVDKQKLPLSLAKDQNSEPVEYLRAQVELLVQEGNLGAAQTAFNKFLDSLVEGGDRFQVEANSAKISLKLDQLDQLFRKNPNVLLETAHNSDLLWNQVLTLSTWVLGNSTWGQLMGNDVAESWTVWFKLRNLLVKFAKISNSTAKVTGRIVNELERHLLIIHWTILLGCITCELEWVCREEFSGLATGQNKKRSDISVQTPLSLKKMRAKLDTAAQALLSLAARLSISLLRYMNLLDSRQVLYTAGQWSLAMGREKLTRICWSKLLELHSGETLPNEFQSNTFGQVDRAHLAELSPISERQIAEARAWILERLISSSSSSQASSNVSGEDDELQSALETDDNSSAYCLISGCSLNDQGNEDNYEDAQSELLRLGKYQARATDWRILQSASKRQSERSARIGPPKQMALRRILEFMSNELGKIG